MRLWRITRARHAAEALSGAGARRFSARWNPAGVAVVYTSTTLSLAAMETLVHAGSQTEPDDLVFLTADADIDREAFEGDKARLLRKLPAPVRDVDERLTQEIGAAWCAGGKSLLLPVPSAVVEDEWNVLINPLHPDASRLKLSVPKPFRFDARLFR